MPEVQVNDRRLPWREGMSLAAALDALNGEFIARDRREAIQLAPDDAVTVFETIVGG